MVTSQQKEATRLGSPLFLPRVIRLDEASELELHLRHI